MAVLRALVRGDGAAARELGRALAEQILSSELVRVAVDVLRGGEHEDRRIAELAERVLDAREALTKRGAA